MKDSLMLPSPSFSPANLIDWLGLAGTLMGAVLFILLPFELWKRWRSGALDKQYWLEMAANFSTLIPTALTAGLSGTFILWLFNSAASAAPWQLSVSIPTAILALLIVDFVYYWDHRFAHRIGILWAAMHSVHHSSPIFNQTTAMRISFVDGFVSPLYYSLIVLAGVDPLLVLAAFGLNLGYQQWIHTENIGKLGWFDRWFNSPSNHRVHHGSQSQYLDKNYGGILIIWDRLFGTYEPEIEPVNFGLTQPIASVNPIVVHVIELVRLLRKIRVTKGVTAKLALLVQPPSGTPTPA
jgi:sterol desaturase/sphingolipid hydroxylase (fatty acid hydroxylase superfamily)